MTDFLLIAIAAATVNNIVLERLLGLCPLLGTDSRVDNALTTGLATTCALTVTAGLSHLLNQWLLVPWGLAYLRIIALLALAALTVQAVNVLLKRHGAGRLRFASQRLPLITMNCAVLGVALLTTGTANTLGGRRGTWPRRRTRLYGGGDALRQPAPAPSTVARSAAVARAGHCARHRRDDVTRGPGIFGAGNLGSLPVVPIPCGRACKVDHFSAQTGAEP